MKQELLFIEGLLNIRYCTKMSMYTVLFNPYKKAGFFFFFFQSPFYTFRNYGTEKLNSLPKVAQPVKL